MNEIKVTVLDNNGDVVNPTFKERAQAAWDVFKRKVTPIVDWVRRNPKEALGWALAIFGIIKAGRRALGKTATEKERHIIQHQYYDPHTGHHWILRRPLTNLERSELAYRQRNGEYTEDILDDLGVLL